MRTRNRFQRSRVSRLVVILICAACSAGLPAFAGKPTKWADLPKPVRDTVLASGGTEGNVDKESETRDGQAVYEAQVKDKDGNVKDLVITQDGKLVETKTDDA